MTETEWLACTDQQPMLDFLDGKASDRKVPIMFTVTYFLACAGQDRAMKVAAKAGVDPQRMVKHFAKKN